MFRTTYLHQLIGNPFAGSLTVSHASDFLLDPGRRVTHDELAALKAVPYVVDLRHGRTLYAVGIDVEQARQASFLYFYLRGAAREVLSVPWEWGRVYPRQHRFDTIFLFSPGRCGSTLLNNILVAAGAESVSEPDIYQAFLSRTYLRAPPMRPVLRYAVRNATEDIATLFGTLGRPFIIKLRLELCQVPRAILACGSQPAKSIFLTRRFETWAKSMAQAFDISPQRIILHYKRSLDCYAYLRRHSECHVMRYEDLVERPKEMCAALGDFIGVKLSSDAVAEAMQRDSQAATPLNRGIVKTRTRWEELRTEVLGLWHSSDLPKQSKELGLN